ncbi:MAG: hypothetical protein WCJ35_10745 [Planctomycetota bacterium]
MIALKQGHQDIAGLIKQTETLRTSLRDTLLKTNELLKDLNHYRRQSRAMESTIASLRQLNTLSFWFLYDPTTIEEVFCGSTRKTQ